MRHPPLSIPATLLAPVAVVFALLPAALAPSPAAATVTPKKLGTFKDWSAHLLREKRGKVCYLYAEPKSQKGKYKRRGATFVQLAHRPAEKIRNEFSITAGYSYKKNSQVTVAIGKRRYKLFTVGDGAWARDRKTDLALVKAMKGGAKMVVSGTSQRGTRTVDTYSLLGFTAAYRAIERACKAN
jgi:Invasion associated locus B (IalB) protein